MPDIDSLVDGRRVAGTLVTGNFFQVLGVTARLGRTLMPYDDERSAGQPVMVLSDRGWDRVFARDPAVLGRRLLVNGLAMKSSASCPKGFAGSPSVRRITGRRSRCSAR